MISAIAAIAEKNKVIGNKGKIPWHISEDFKNFKQITLGHPVIMGQKTFETLKNPLPMRTNIVITDNKNYKAPEEVFVTYSIEEALDKAKEAEGNEEIFIIGGGQIYKLAMPFVERLYLTLVEGDFEGDVFFPDYSEFKKEISSKKSEESSFRYRFVVLER